MDCETILMVYRSPPSKTEMRQGGEDPFVSSTLKTIEMVLRGLATSTPT
jgi:hypothetical protein